MWRNENQEGVDSVELTGNKKVKKMVRFLIPGDVEGSYNTVKKDITKVKPDVVLFLGDYVGGGMFITDDNIPQNTPIRKHEGKKREIAANGAELFKFLNGKKIYTYFIRGNHDDAETYEFLIEETFNLPYVKEISNKIIEYAGIRILGVPYQTTHSIREARKIKEKFSAPIDIVIAHAEYKRRVWLFELKAKFIITGHFGNELCSIGDKIYTSLSLARSEYVTIEYTQDEQLITYVRRSDQYYYTQVRISGNKVEWIQDDVSDGIKPLKEPKETILYGPRSIPSLKVSYENLIQAQKVIKDMGESEQKEVIQQLLNKRIPKAYINEYLGNKYLRLDKYVIPPMLPTAQICTEDEVAEDKSKEFIVLKDT